jgi:hypothetical protein
MRNRCRRSLKKTTSSSTAISSFHANGIRIRIVRTGSGKADGTTGSKTEDRVSVRRNGSGRLTRIGQATGIAGTSGTEAATETDAAIAKSETANSSAGATGIGIVGLTAIRTGTRADRSKKAASREEPKINNTRKAFERPAGVRSR